MLVAVVAVAAMMAATENVFKEAHLVLRSTRKFMAL